MRLFLPQTLVVMICASVASCQDASSVSPASASASKAYSVTGLVSVVQPAQQRVVVKHDAIPDYMEAMTMPFDVRDTNELTGLIPGEQITFQLIVTEDDAWIETIEKTGVAENILPNNSGIRIVRDVDPLEIGDVLPDYPFIDEQGRTVRLSQFKGKALVLSFLFTRCPLPEFCPLTAKKLVETQNRLKQGEAAAHDWRILAITVDPKFDTPERLRQFGEMYGYDPDRFSLLTGELIDITALAEQFGLMFWTEEGIINHNLRTVVVGADGTIRTNMIGNEWTVPTLINEVTQAVAAAPRTRSQ